MWSYVLSDSLPDLDSISRLKWTAWSSCSATCGEGIAHRISPSLGKVLSTCRSNTSTCPGTVARKLNSEKGSLSHSCVLSVDGGWTEWQSIEVPYRANCRYVVSNQGRDCTSPKPSLGGAGCQGDYLKKELHDLGHCNGKMWTYAT